MAISEDTAALVAAQLTVAWATRAGTRPADPRLAVEDEVKRIYAEFFEDVRDAPPGEPFVL